MVNSSGSLRSKFKTNLILRLTHFVKNDQIAFGPILMRYFQPFLKQGAFAADCIYVTTYEALLWDAFEILTVIARLSYFKKQIHI